MRVTSAQLRKIGMAPLLINLGIAQFIAPRGIVQSNSADAKPSRKTEKDPWTPGNNMIVVKQRNLAAMMALIKLRKISTNDLVAKTKLSRSTISNLADELIKDGMIVCDQSKRPWRFSATAKGKK